MVGSDRERRDAVLVAAELRSRRRGRTRAARRAATQRAVAALQLAASARPPGSR
jgi:hypothetical protein